MKQTITILLLLSLCLASASCNIVSKDNTPDDMPRYDYEISSPSPAPIDAGSDSETTAPPRIQARSEFSFEIEEITLTLRERDPEDKFTELPMKKISETERQLEDYAGYMRSFEKTVKFEGLEIKLFSPEEDGEGYWITGMTAISPGIRTSRGIEVGDGLERLFEKYQENDIEPYNGDGDGNIYRFIKVDPYQAIEFTVAAEKITRISLIYNME